MFLSLHIKFNYPADCTWSVISSHSNLNREYTTLGLFCGKCPIQISHPMSLRHPVLHVKYYFFRLESQSTIYFSRSLLPRVFEKRPTGCISNLPIQPIARGVSFLAKKWHCVKKWHSAWLFRVHVTLSSVLTHYPLPPPKQHSTWGLRLKSQSTIYFSRSLLPRYVEKRPTGWRLQIEIEWHSKYKYKRLWLMI